MHSCDTFTLFAAVELTKEGARLKAQRERDLGKLGITASGNRVNMTESQANAYKATHLPICVSWSNVKVRLLAVFSVAYTLKRGFRLGQYTVQLSQGIGKPKKDLEVLHGCSGVVLPGEMLAIIGETVASQKPAFFALTFFNPRRRIGCWKGGRGYDVFRFADLTKICTVNIVGHSRQSQNYWEDRRRADVQWHPSIDTGAIVEAHHRCAGVIFMSIVVAIVGYCFCGVAHIDIASTSIRDSGRYFVPHADCARNTDVFCGTPPEVQSSGLLFTTPR